MIFCEHCFNDKEIASIICAVSASHTSDKEISDQEWQELIVSMDSQWNNAISRFHVKYQLSKEELYLVCLSLTDFPFAHLAYLMHSSRRTLYRKKNALCERIGVEQNSEFKEILRKI